MSFLMIKWKSRITST